MRITRFAVAFLLASFSLLATPGACPTAANGTDLNSLNTLNGGGCAQFDFQFLSFGLGAGPGDTFGAIPLSSAFLYASGGVPSATANFDGNPNSPWAVPGDNTGGELDSVLTYYVTSTTDLTGLSFGALNVTGNGLVSIVESYCLGASTTAGCTPGNGGSISAVIFGGSILSESPAASFGPGFQMVAISEEIILPNSNGSPTSLDLFGNTFDEFQAPEPATFLLLGSGLAGVAFLRRRQRRRD
jgi:hypothetical protein